MIPAGHFFLRRLCKVDSILNRIREIYPTLSKGQKRIADYIDASFENAAFLTAARLGEEAGVSESTVVRFAYAVGFDGYPEMQDSLQELIRHKLTSAQRIHLTEGLNTQDVPRRVLSADMNNIKATIDMIDPVVFTDTVNALLSAERIYVLGVGSAYPLAQFLANYLGYSFDDVIYTGGSEQDIFERMLRISERDICFGITFPRYSSRTVTGMRYAKERGAKLIALTDLPTSPIAKISDYILLARSDMASFADSLTAPLSVVNALLVSISILRKEETYDHLMQLEKIWSMEGVYFKESDRDLV